MIKTDNSKVNYNLISENKKLKERINQLEKNALKEQLINKLLHLGSTIEICNSSKTSKKAKELAHTLLDEYLEYINCG